MWKVSEEPEDEKTEMNCRQTHSVSLKAETQILFDKEPLGQGAQHCVRQEWEPAGVALLRSRCSSLTALWFTM